MTEPLEIIIARSDIRATSSSDGFTICDVFEKPSRKERKFKVLKNVNDKKLMCLHSSNLSAYQMFEIFLLSLPREDDGMSSESYHITRYFLLSHLRSRFKFS